VVNIGKRGITYEEVTETSRGVVKRLVANPSCEIYQSFPAQPAQPIQHEAKVAEVAEVSPFSSGKHAPASPPPPPDKRAVAQGPPRCFRLS
jgi:hypothetical protein